ncbi:Hypothetical protein CINCED_3A022428 [Cinara cedri]|uniref:Uncharacterized protein n=1 Tax=Cinara cedri TaxID=506608 RepID=A0A5E4MMS0_9HEMI|nr:Hypothetical protein CINCED_3A022428 [Cinara cedri]
MTYLVNCEGPNSILIKEEICGSFNSYLRGKFSKFFSARHGVKAKLPKRLDTTNKMGQRIVQVIGKEDLEIINKKYKNPVSIPYKKELADVKLDDLLEELPEILAQLRIENYYLMDFDITQDFVGVFNKTEMTRFLTDNQKFCNRGEYDDGSNIIVDNNKTVEVVEDEANNENISIIQKCYIKAGETFFSRSGTSFSAISKEINIEDTGLTKTNNKNVIPQILKKRSNITNKLSPYTIKEIDHLSSKWRNLDTDGFDRISTFTVNNKRKYPYVGVLAEKVETKSVYFLKGSLKKLFINIYNIREKLKEEGYVLIPFNEMVLIVLPTEETIITFNTNGVTTFNGNSFAKVENVQFFSEVLRNMDDQNNI